MKNWSSCLLLGRKTLLVLDDLWDRGVEVPVTLAESLGLHVIEVTTLGAGFLACREGDWTRLRGFSCMR